MIDRSRTPESDSCSVRGIGVAVRVSTCTSERSCLQPLLVGDAEMLFLVDDQQAEIVEPDALGQQRMGADDDIDGAARQPVAGRLRPPLRETKRDSWRDLQRKAPEAFGESWRSAGGRAAWWARSPPPARPTWRRRRRRASPPRSCRSRHRRRSAGPSACRWSRSSSTSAMARQLVVGLLVGKAGAELLPGVVRRVRAPGPCAGRVRRRCGSAGRPSRGCVP